MSFGEVYYLLMGLFVGASTVLLCVRMLLVGKVIHYTVGDEPAIYLELDRDISHLLSKKYVLFKVSPRK